MAQDLALTEEFKWLAQASFDSDDLGDAQAGGRGEVADTLSIAGNIFSFKTSEGTFEAQNPRQLYFVYLGGKKPKSRALYAGAFNDDDPQAPRCTSFDGVTPEPDSDVPVITEPTHPRVGECARSCRECPMSKWGSAISAKTGKPVPACKEHKDIAVKVIGMEGAYLFKLPPAGWTSWDKATAKIKTAIDADKAAHDGKTLLSLGNAVFSVSFGPGMGNLIFEPKAWLQGPELAAVAALRRDPDATDKLLWGPEGTGRRLQYEGGRGKAIDPAGNMPAPVGTHFAVAPTSANPLGTQLPPVAAQPIKTLEQEKLVTAPVVPEKPVKAATKPAKASYTNVSDIMEAMGLSSETK